MKSSSYLIPCTALLLTGSGACALIYQVAWFREFQLVFGSTTAATAAVVAIFMGGLGLGNAVLGKRADRQRNPLGFYARLELSIAVIAALTPLLIGASRWAYIGLGGQMTMGAVGATAIRLALASLVILLPTFLMGGTLPAAVAAVTTGQDLKRRAAGLLYGCNTLGAVVGTMVSTFLLLAWIGVRATLWSACVLNLAVAALAFLLSRSSSVTQTDLKEEDSTDSTVINSVTEAPGPSPSSFIPHPSSLTIYAAAAIVGFGFMLMELVWYRMLAPILGGTTYTFGLILAMALLGIGIGGILYPLLFHRRFSPSLSALSLTCGLEAVLIAVPFALGDKLAYGALTLHINNTFGFTGEVFGWAKIAAIVVLPAAIVSGVQFPLLLALLGRAKRDVGRQLGYTYVANTGGSIAGSLAGGFGLLPLLSAPGAWRLVVVLLAALSLVLALVSLIVHFRTRPAKNSAPATTPSIPAASGGTRSNWLYSLACSLGVSLLAVALMNSTGPTAFWRHGSIGAGRQKMLPDLSPNGIQKWKNDIKRSVVWQADGVEAGVAITVDSSMSFYVNGRTDGNALGDASTQIASGVLAALLHPNPETCLVVGLGTGETAGWLGVIPAVKEVDVVEIEPAIREMARRCTSINGDVLNNPQVRQIYNDAREVLLSVNKKYDVIASEPSNPYRAGIANLFTQEFYRSVDARLKPGGLFVQWLQGYEIDETAVSTVLATLKSVFKNVEVWQTNASDMLMLCSQDPIVYDLANLRERLGQEPYRSAFAAAWRVNQVEGLFARYVGGNAMVESLAGEYSHHLNTDDLNYLEYGFARTFGNKTGFDIHQLYEIARKLSANQPHVSNGRIDWDEVEEERMAMYALMVHTVPIPPEASVNQKLRGQALQKYLKKDYQEMVDFWESQSRQATYPTETALLALAYAELGNDKALELIGRLRSFNPCEAELIRGILLFRQGREQEASETLSKAFVAMRKNPWPLRDVAEHALKTAVELARYNEENARRFLSALEKPFDAMKLDLNRQWIACFIASAIDSKTVVPWIERFEPHIPWTEQFLRLRVRAYAETGHPLAEQAERDLQLFQKQELESRGTGYFSP